MEFLKKYQVSEHKDGLWSVVSTERQSSMGAQLIASISMRTHGFSTAAEAQEMADHLNGELNETNNNPTQESEALTAQDSDNASRS